jgi:hypothetical protein
MSRSVLKNLGVGCFVACAILLCVAFDRYRDNANQVEAANKMLQAPLQGMMDQMKSSPIGGAMGQVFAGAKLEPGMPESTKYALVLAVFAAAGGVVCMVKSTNAAAGNPSQQVTSPNP